MFFSPFLALCFSRFIRNFASGTRRTLKILTYSNGPRNLFQNLMPEFKKKSELLFLIPFSISSFYLIHFFSG
ncbi:hypothetical protein EVA_15967 [gut metagenome]|uniref:Uncharacterized protein n=1 Tax=gut metagenome TaxID=749906 RepID=J9FLY3_9ZZZZ